MKKIIALIVLAALVSACCTPKPIIQESSATERIEYRERVVEVAVVDTVEVQVPMQSQADVVADSSHLETAVAVSDAWIRSDGLLAHKLKNKPITLSSEIEYRDRIVYRDSLIYRDRSVTNTVEVKKPLNKVQKFLLGSGIFLWLLLIVYILLRVRGVMR